MSETILEWQEGLRGTRHKITVSEEDSGYLVMKQKRLKSKWKVEESWYSEGKPDLKAEALE